MSEPIGAIASGAFSVIKGVWDYLEAGDIAFRTDHATSTAHPKCDETCEARRSTIEVIDVTVEFLGLKRARCQVFLAFDWNGCDVRNVRAVVGNKSFTGFLSGASFEVEASAGPSFFTSDSKCECCSKSACVTFDINVTSDAALTFGTGRATSSFLVCADGSVTDIPTP